MSTQQVSLQALVEAILNSATQAQDQIDKINIRNFQQWFDDGQPRCMPLKLPLKNDNANKDKETTELTTLHVPLVSLFHSNPIKIKRMLTRFEVGLDAVSQADPGVIEGEPANQQKDSIVIEAEKRILASLYNNHTSQMASVEIEFEGGEPAEGYLRVMNEVYKFI